MVLDLFEHETDAGEMSGDGGAPDLEADAPSDVVAPVEAAPAWDPNDQGFRDAVAREASAIIEARMSEYQPPIPQPQTDPLDLNEFLNPLSDEFGQNFAQVLAFERQQTLQAMQQMVAPLMAPVEQQQRTQDKQLVDQLVAEKWGTADGAPTPEITEAVEGIAASLLPQFNQMFGIPDGPNSHRHPLAHRAAEMALSKAAETIRAINRAAARNGGQANIDGLAAVANAAGEPGTNGGALQMPPPALSPREVFERRFPTNGVVTN